MTSGTVTLEGRAEDVKKKLEVNPKTKIPQILFTVYQHVFNSIYMVSSILNTPYPPPDLLHPMAEKIQILNQPTAKPESTDASPQQEQVQAQIDTSATASVASSTSDEKASNQ